MAQSVSHQIIEINRQSSNILLILTSLCNCESVKTIFQCYLWSLKEFLLAETMFHLFCLIFNGRVPRMVSSAYNLINISCADPKQSLM